MRRHASSIPSLLHRCILWLLTRQHGQHVCLALTLRLLCPFPAISSILCRYQIADEQDIAGVNCAAFLRAAEMKMRTSRLEGAQRSPASWHSWDTYASQLATKFPEIAAHTCSQDTPNVELRIAWALQQVLPGQSGPEIHSQL